MDAIGHGVLEERRDLVDGWAVRCLGCNEADLVGVDGLEAHDAAARAGHTARMSGGDIGGSLPPAVQPHLDAAGGAGVNQAKGKGFEREIRCVSQMARAMPEAYPPASPHESEKHIPSPGSRPQVPDKTLWIWSGDILMDLGRYQALKTTVKEINRSDYLFIEAGGCSTRNLVGWKPPWYVMKRATE